MGNTRSLCSNFDSAFSLQKETLKNEEPYSVKELYHNFGYRFNENNIMTRKNFQDGVLKSENIYDKIKNQWTIYFYTNGKKEKELYYTYLIQNQINFNTNHEEVYIYDSTIPQAECLYGDDERTVKHIKRKIQTVEKKEEIIKKINDHITNICFEKNNKYHVIKYYKNGVVKKKTGLIQFRKFNDNTDFVFDDLYRYEIVRVIRESQEYYNNRYIKNIDKLMYKNKCIFFY